jgi:O-antigen/teichoic acid export membrane protein
LSNSRAERRIAAGSLASLVSFIVGAATTLLQVPILLSVWPPERFGLWTIVMATYGLIVVADAGHQEYVCRRIVLAGAARADQVRGLLGSAIRVALLVALLEISVAVLLVSSPLQALGPTALVQHSEEHRQASIALVALVAFFATFGSVGGVVVRLYEANGSLARATWIGVFSRIVTFAAVTITALCGGSILSTAAAVIAVGIVFAAFIFVDVRRRFPHLWPWWHSGRLRDGVSNFLRSTAVTAASGIEQIGSVTLLNMSGRLHTPNATASFATSRTVGNTLTQASSVLLSPIYPELGRYIGSADGRKVEVTLTAATIISTIPLCLGVTAVAGTLPWAYESWTRRAVGFDGELIALLIGAALVRQWQAPIAVILSASASSSAMFVVSAVRVGTMVAVAAIALAVRASPAALGIAVIAGEILGAATCVVAGASVCARLGAKVPIASLTLSALGVAIATGASMLVLTGRATWQQSVPISLLALCGAALWQIRLLPPELRGRARALLH